MGGKRRPVFVLHEHERPRHHFDLRLEEDGVLRSWAVPKGLPTRPGADRLAVPVDHHDVDHAAYEDATKSIADTGWWELEDRNERRFVFVLHGRGGARRYALISTGRDALLHLLKDQPDPERKDHPGPEPSEVRRRPTRDTPEPDPAHSHTRRDDEAHPPATPR